MEDHLGKFELEERKWTLGNAKVQCWPMKAFFSFFLFFVIIVRVWASFHVPQLHPWAPEVNEQVNPLVALRGLELVTVGVDL